MPNYTWSFWWHMMKAMVKHCMGRWYVFRNVPDIHLDTFVYTIREAPESFGESDPSFDDFLKAAVQEHSTRAAFGRRVN